MSVTSCSESLDMSVGCFLDHWSKIDWMAFCNAIMSHIHESLSRIQIQMGCHMLTTAPLLDENKIALCNSGKSIGSGRGR